MVTGNETKATPGPYNIIGGGEQLTQIVKIGPGQRLDQVARMHRDWLVSRDDAEVLANALLFKAAPDLLAAAQMQEDADRFGQLIGGGDIHGIVAIVDKYPALLAQDMSEEAAFNILSGAARESRRAAIAAAEGRSSVCPACNQRVPLDGGRLAVHDHPATQERCSFSGEGAAS